MDTFTITVAIDIIGILVGIVSIGIITKTRSQLGGAVGKGLNTLIWGVLFETSAFVWTIIFTRFKLFTAPFGLDVHHLLMTIAMVLFVAAALRFSKTVSV